MYSDLTRNEIILLSLTKRMLSGFSFDSEIRIGPGHTKAFSHFVLILPR